MKYSRVWILLGFLAFPCVVFAQTGPAPAQLPVVTAIPTPSPTWTPSSTWTPSPTVTATHTTTGTQSPSATYTKTLTPTHSSTFTSTASPTRTYSKTPTFSSTFTVTGTRSPSATFTRTWTITPTPTRTHTPTVTLSPSPTFTPSPTVTRSPTITPTPTITPGVFQFVVSTKPDAQGRISFSWGVNIPAERVYLKIYTSGYRLARDFEFNKLDSPDYLTKGTHMFYWNGKDEQNRPMPPGSYLCLIDINVKKKVYEASSKTQIP